MRIAATQLHQVKRHCARRTSRDSAAPFGGDLLQQRIGARFDWIELNLHPLHFAGQPLRFVELAPSQQPLRLFHRQGGILMLVSVGVVPDILRHQIGVAMHQRLDLGRAVFR